MPFIDLIVRKLDIMQLDGGIDYRLENLRAMDVFITPAVRPPAENWSKPSIA